MKRSPRPWGLLATLGLMVAASPAQASLVNTYGSSDDAWGTPIGPGRTLVDLRLNPILGGTLRWSTSASLVYGVGAAQEIGLCAGYLWSEPGTAQAASGPSVLNPYYKAQLPWQPGGVTLGLVTGLQVPTQPSMDTNMALEAIAAVPLGGALVLDLDLGVGRSLLTGAALGHGAAALYVTGPGGWNGVGEVFTNLTSLGAPIYGQHLALTIPLTAQLTGDAGLALNEDATGTLTCTPQVGATLLW